MQITLPLRFLTLSAHFVAVLTVIFDVVCMMTVLLHMALQKQWLELQ